MIHQLQASMPQRKAHQSAGHHRWGCYQHFQNEGFWRQVYQIAFDGSIDFAAPLRYLDELQDGADERLRVERSASFVFCGNLQLQDDDRAGPMDLWLAVETPTRSLSLGHDKQPRYKNQELTISWIRFWFFSAWWRADERAASSSSRLCCSGSSSTMSAQHVGSLETGLESC